MQRTRELLALVLLGLLPFHALLVTVGTRVMLGAGRAPLGWLAGWKEGVLGLMLALAIVEAVSLKVKKTDVIDGLILAFIGLAVLVSAMTVRLGSGAFVLGVKYDLVWLIALLVLRHVPWSEAFRHRAVRLLLIVGVVASLYAIATFFLPLRFFTWLGYSPAHSLYVPSGPLQAFSQIGGSAIRRVQGAMSGPNQLGLWLLLPWSVLLVSFFERVIRPSSFVMLFLIIGAALLLTFSRAAWIGALVIFVVILGTKLPRRAFVKTAGGLAGALLAAATIAVLWNPAIFLRLGSNSEHLSRPLAALRLIREHPLGRGLGTAGPATNRLKEACVYLLAGDDPSWAVSNPNLCVFVAGTQVQPTDHVCDCPFLPENWYLQIGIEVGIVGMLLFVTIAALLLWRGSREGIGQIAHLFLLGIALAGLFLHSWEDAGVAYMLAIFLALPATALPENRSADRASI